MSPLRPVVRFLSPKIFRRYQSTETKPPNPHSNFYKEFGRPLVKNFLIAVATYQVLYWGWMKLESIEIKKGKNDEVKQLENEIWRMKAAREGEK